MTQLGMFEQNQTMSVYEFGRELIVTGDLDPVYVVLHRAQLPEKQLMRFLLAYWMFYSMGTAARCAEAKDFYSHVNGSARNGDQRGTERRHFRGQSCYKAINWFEEQFPQPEDAVQSLAKFKTFLALREAVMKWPMFGPWIAFKVADMLERVLHWPVDFSDCNLLVFYQEPKAGAEILAAKENTMPDVALAKLMKHFSKTPAPPSGDRSCGVQEIETILCKWKSYLKGHYYVGKDWHEIKEGLLDKGELAQHLLDVAR